MGALLVVIVGLLIWSARFTFATAVIDRKLARAHVRARFRLTELGPAHQRLVDVVIGDPRRPDLTADMIELATSTGFDGVMVTAVRARRLRLHGRLQNGRFSLGSMDRLLPSPSTTHFRLPAIDLDLQDGRLLLTAPSGEIEATLSGKGRLDGGFRGLATAVAQRLAVDGCVVAGAWARIMVAIDAGEPSISGPLRTSRLTCGPIVTSQIKGRIAATLTREFTSWRGSTQLYGADLLAPYGRFAGLAGMASFAGTGARTNGTFTLASAARFRNGIAAKRIAAAGRYAIGPRLDLSGRLIASGVAIPFPMIAAIRRYADAANGTPVAPLADKAATALRAAAREIDATADVALRSNELSVSHAAASAKTGAAITVSSRGGAQITMRGGQLVGSATIELSGGSLPNARIDVAATPGRASGTAIVAAYSAGAARVDVAPVQFTFGPHGGAGSTVATLSGPLPNGFIDGFTLPVAVSWNGVDRFAIGPPCIDVGAEHVRVAGLRLNPARLSLCPAHGALVRIARGKVQFDGRLAPLRLTGTLGASPIQFQAGSAAVSRDGVSAENVALRLGAGATATRLELAHLTGRLDSDGIAGQFAGAGGQLGSVPLSLSKGVGHWALAGSVLSLDGAADLADADALPRFKPLRAERIAMRIASGGVQASAHLVTTVKAISIADFVLTHDLARGTGHADLTVPRLTFDDGFQPDALTPFTFGVIADVRGAIAGDAHLAWSGTGIASNGVFKTEGIDLAAAVGPVTGLAGTIRFTDLLGLESAPDQVATIATINPGVAVTGGTLTYQTLPGARVRIASAHWPFAGGSLDLRPTVLDLGTAAERHLTFTLARVDAGKFLQQFNFPNISATGAFEGNLPIIFDAQGGRIESGYLKVRSGGGNLAYVGDLAQHDLGLWGNLAFQALRSIDYRDLDITMNGPLAGEMITRVRFSGISQGRGAKSNFLIRRLQRLPFVFNIQIKAPFRSLIDSAQTFYDPTSLIERNLPALIEQQNDAVRRAPVQPPVTGKIP